MVQSDFNAVAEDQQDTRIARKAYQSPMLVNLSNSDTKGKQVTTVEASINSGTAS